MRSNGEAARKGPRFVVCGKAAEPKESCRRQALARCKVAETIRKTACCRPVIGSPFHAEVQSKFQAPLFWQSEM